MAASPAMDRVFFSPFVRRRAGDYRVYHREDAEPGASRRSAKHGAGSFHCRTDYGDHHPGSANSALGNEGGMVLHFPYPVNHLRLLIPVILGTQNNSAGIPGGVAKSRRAPREMDQAIE